MPSPRWIAVSDSAFPWEADALAWLRERLPASEAYHGWSNFEFVASDGSVNEVDALILTPRRLILVEIKSRPGRVDGHLGHWTWTDANGRQEVTENPLVLANRKAKRLAGLLQRTRALSKLRAPFVEAAVFLSHRELDCRLDGPAGTRVFTRMAAPQSDRNLPGWLAADAEVPPAERMDLTVRRAVHKALDEVGLRKIQREFTVGDWRLTRLLHETDVYQDWVGTHVRTEGSQRRIRLYPWPTSGPETGRKARRRAADREFDLLERAEHPGILRAQSLTETERGLALVFEHPEPSERLDAFLLRRASALDLRQRLALVREIADALTYAHGRHLYHRALTPHAVLVTNPDAEAPRVKLLNWQLGALEELTSGDTRLTWHDFIQVGLGGQEANAVYLAPEVRTGGQPDPALLDVFSLGALAYHLLTGVAPAPNQEELIARLANGQGLELAAVMNGADEDLAALIQLATSPEVGMRPDAATFLAEIDAVIGKIAAPAVEGGRFVHPLDAEKGSELEGGFVVTRRLGSGSTAIALQVERGDKKGVLKIARTLELNDRLLQEAEVLRQLRHQHVAELFETTQVSGHAALFVELAGEQTLAQRLHQEGALTLDLLQRFGDELLTVVDWLEQNGVAHRDLKPDNIGVGETRKGKLTLVLFDFSLSGTPGDNIRAGTPGYLDPFLVERRPQRWDSAAERYAAAVTLHEMATGVLPQWGDGRQHPATLPPETTPVIATERLDPAVRDALTRFFLKALARDPRKRFDTAEEMRRAWARIFEAIDRPATVTDSGSVDVAAAIASADAATPLGSLGFTPRVLNALERLGVHNVRELADLPGTRLYGAAGIGARTLRDIRELATVAARTLAERGAAPGPEAAGGDADDPSVDPRLWSVDLLARQLITNRLPTPEPQVLRQLTGLEAPLDADAPDAWPSQRDVAELLGISRAQVSDVVERARTRWGKKPWMTVLRDDVARLLNGMGGVATREELAGALLLARGSTEAAKGERLRRASAVLWAALEIESTRETSCRFRLQRGEQHLLAVSGACDGPESLPADPAVTLRWVEALGTRADELAAIDPPLPPQRALEELSAIEMPAGLAPLAPERLLRLAVSASRAAALSPRQELYPRGFSAERALALGAGALLGVSRLTADQVRQRIASRYPDAQELPGRPALDRLLAEAGLEMRWDENSQAYVQRPLGSGSSTGTITRQATVAGVSTVGGTAPADPAQDEIRELERRLRSVVTEGRFLALVVEPKYLVDADRALTNGYGLRRLSLERILLEAMREEATRLRADWKVVEAADGAPRDGREWRQLQQLAQRAKPRLEAALRVITEPTLLVHAGLLARYGLLSVVQPLQDRSRQGAGVALLIPCDGQHPLPVVDGVTLPMVYPTDWTELSRTWVRRRRPAA